MIDNKLNPCYILFCHYGNSDYLYYTLKQAKLTNPGSHVVLLGDNENEHIAKKAKVAHYHFKDFYTTNEIKTFDKVYKHVAGVKHGKEFWTNFVFKRWFYIHGFVKEKNINSFWHFDSDNLILTNVQKQEYKFVDYDCTEQCNGKCINGFVSSFKVIDGYVKKINELFLDENYLNIQRKDFIKHPNYAFTEMRAYTAYKNQENVNSIRLNAIINNESFDDCICMNHGYETYNEPLKNQFLKKIYFNKQGEFFCYHKESSSYIKMMSLNLSWVPTKLFKLVCNTFKKYYLKKNKSNTNTYFSLNIYKANSLRTRILSPIPKPIKKRIKGWLK
ncbi:hypothetical protein [Neotamlana laminarinivorans]|uniref:Uncharacterized protein n=1 Tax=Neotamlana laminarinivorans TaxID=2883124 RepID=A0A9X1L4N5_9FLAO|nr:hypothetical protein [Tamlana laminarinivorans]MCB4799694.1 hypothetical protein [Tamlana laminarinivorans]